MIKWKISQKNLSKILREDVCKSQAGWDSDGIVMVTNFLLPEIYGVL